MALVISISGCTPAKIPPTASSPVKFTTSTTGDKSKSKLLIYREHAIIGSLADAVIGINGTDAFALPNKKHVIFELNPGNYVIYTRGEYADRPFELTINLKPDTTTCLKTFVPASGAVKMIVPLLHHMSSTYHLEEVPCPSDQFLADYPRYY